MTTMIAVAIALLAGVVAGWLFSSMRRAGETQRLLAERDLARQERERSEVARAAMQRRVEEVQQQRAAADTRVTEAEKLLANHEQLRKQIEDSFAALAQRAFKSVGESLVQMNK